MKVARRGSPGEAGSSLNGRIPTPGNHEGRPYRWWAFMVSHVPLRFILQRDNQPISSCTRVRKNLPGSFFWPRWIGSLRAEMRQ